MENVNNFKLVCRVKCLDKFDVEKYQSTKTGLTVVVGHVPGPTVSGYFVLATEAFDDDGLPHTLEHLIFLGSEDYPYKGVLDLLANRSLASGTNAWTDTDHTCYTVTTAGSEGFLYLMPVYIDHILYPVLTESGFVTEVHHVTGDGEDAGIVYCEMQGTENCGETRVRYELNQAAYPGRCGYKSETGALMKNLQESTTNAKVKKYHQDFYRPDNLTLIITGDVNTEEVFKVLAGVEEKILKKGKLPPFNRPWQSVPPPVTATTSLEIPYACDEEENGLVYTAWRGPSAVTELYKMHATSMLLKYLADNAASPLQQEFVQTDDPLASSIDYHVTENSSTLIFLGFRNVPFDKLNSVEKKVMDKLRELRSAKEVFDMERMSALINKQKLELLLSMETKPHSSIAYSCIGDMLYGNTVDDLKLRLNPLEMIEKLGEEKAEFWINLFDEYLINNHSTTIVGKPSVSERDRLDKAEKERIQKQVETLGKEGLKEKARILEEATKFNERPPPSSMLTLTPVPDPARISFHKVTSFNTHSPPPAEKLDVSEFPLFVHIDHIGTNFVYLMVLMDSSPLPPNLRMYLPLYMESILESNILRDGKLISHIDVVNEFENDTISAATSIGVTDCGHFTCGPFAQTVAFAIQVHPSNYAKGVNWLRELLYNACFHADRLSVTAAKLVNEVAEIRRMNAKLTRDISDELNYQKDNNIHCNNAIRQHKFLSDVGKELCSGKESAIADLERVRQVLTDPANMVIRIAVDLDAVAKTIPGGLVAPWKKFLPADKTKSAKPLPIVLDHQLLRVTSETDSVVCALRSTESAYLVQTVPCISDPYHPDLPALTLFLDYLTQLEGPMWKLIRGQGLSYGFGLNQKTSQGLLLLSLYRATNVISAYNKAKEIVEMHLKPDVDFDPVLLVSAKNLSVFHHIQREDTVSNVIKENIFSYFKGTDSNYSREFVKKLNNVTVEDMKRVGHIYAKDLFNPKKVRLSLLCPLTKSDEVHRYFKTAGFNVKIATNLSDVFLADPLKE